jgi:hypothetical protein
MNALIEAIRVSLCCEQLLVAKLGLMQVILLKPDYIWIVAVMHMKRRPAYWRERL